MRNIIQQQDDLKNLSQQQLVMAMQSGTYPQFLVLSELNRRKRMTDDQARREAADNTTTVAQEVVNAAGVPRGGIAQLASAMNAQTDNTQNTGVRQMAEGGVVKMQTAGKPPSIMSNIMSLMSPPSYDVAGLSKPRVAQEPEMTALEALETIPPDAARALEISKKIQVGKSVKKVLKEAKLTGLEALNLIAGAGAYLSLDTAYKTLNAIGTLFEDDEARVIFDMAQTLKDRQTDKLFKKHGNWLQRNLPRINPNFAYTFDDREKVAEQLSLEELNVIKMARQAALDEAQKPVEAGGDPSIAASLFAEGTPSLPITGTYKLPRPLDQVGDPMVGGPNKPVVGQRTAADLITAPQISTVDDKIKTGAGLGLGLDTQAIPAAPTVVSQDPFRLEGAAKKELFTNTLSDPSTSGIADFLDKVQSDERLSDVVKQRVRDDTLNDPKALGAVTTDKEFFPEGNDLRSEAISNLNQRALQFLRSDTYTPPSEIYGSTDVYGPELGTLFEQTLKNQQAGIPGGNTPEATMAMNLENAARLREENLANPQLPLSLFERSKMYLEGLGRDISNLSQEDIIEFAKKAGMKGLDLIDDTATAISDEITRRRTNNESAAFDSDTLGVGSEPIDFRAIDKATAEQLKEEQGATDTATQSQIDKLMELLNKQQGAIDKQSGASSVALSEYLSGLEKDREFDKAMALANAGAALMMPSATIGEGVGKAIKAGTKTLQKGKDSYNKNKLQVLALQGRIDAAKASAANRAAISGATLSSRILLARREELADQLERLAPMGTTPRAEFADRVKELRQAIKETDDQLNAMIMTASLGSIPAGNEVFASYNLTG